MQTIIDKLERADGPDREMDRQIARICGPERRWADSKSYGPGVYFNANGSASHCPAYTASIDAAMTLVPEGMAWAAGYGQTLPGDPMGAAVVGRNARFVGYDANYDVVAHGSGVTPALALCIAALRARSQGGE